MNVMEADLSLAVHASVVAELVNVGCVFHVSVRREDGSSVGSMCHTIERTDRQGYPNC